MRITPLGAGDGHPEVFEDPLTGQIVEAVHAQRPLLAFVATVLRDYQTRESLTERAPSLRRLATTIERDRSERHRINEICTAIERLYSKFDPSLVRGAIIEALVQRSIQSRYGGPNDTLGNNLKFRVEDRQGNGHDTTTSIDVIGVCALEEAGECIDCKVASKSFKPDWVKELTEDVAPFGFRIGLATADSRDRTRDKLRRAGVRLGARTTLVTPDTWWAALPLLK